MKIVNLGILAHVDAGKTTLAECMLYQSGVIAQRGNVDQGTAVTDSLELERQRGMSIKTSATSFIWNDCKINLIDTPGHIDFVAEVESVLHILDVVILVISAKEGIQSQTRLFWEKLQELQIPVVIFINKLDRMGVDFEDLVENIKKQLSKNVIVLQDYVGGDKKEILIIPKCFADECVHEKILYLADDLMEKYCNDENIKNEEYKEALFKLIRSTKLYPIVAGISLRNIGVAEVLDLVTELCTDIDGNNDKLSAYVYKVEYDIKGNRRSYFRIFSGSINNREYIEIKGEKHHFVVRNLYSIRNNCVVPVKRVECGDIGLVVGAEQLKVGCILGDGNGIKTNLNIKPPLFETCIKTDETKERYKLLEALVLLGKEDPRLTYEINRLTNEIKVYLFGPLQMEIIKAQIAERFGINVIFSKLTIVHKERPLKKVSCSIRLRDTGNSYNAGVVMTVEPLSLGSGFQYKNRVSYGYLEKPFQNAVYEGVKMGLSKGVNGCEVTDIKVTFEEADYDSVLGTPADFRKLVPIVIRKALSDAGVIVLEPWLRFSITVPKIDSNAVLQDLQKMKAIITGYSFDSEECIFEGNAALEKMMNYDTILYSNTEGKGILKHDFYKFMPITKEYRNSITEGFNSDA